MQVMLKESDIVKCLEKKSFSEINKKYKGYISIRRAFNSYSIHVINKCDLIYFIDTFSIQPFTRLNIKNSSIKNLKIDTNQELYYLDLILSDNKIDNIEISNRVNVRLNTVKDDINTLSACNFLISNVDSYSKIENLNINNSNVLLKLDNISIVNLNVKATDEARIILNSGLYISIRLMAKKVFIEGSQNTNISNNIEIKSNICIFDIEMCSLHKYKGAILSNITIYTDILEVRHFIASNTINTKYNKIICHTYLINNNTLDIIGVTPLNFLNNNIEFKSIRFSKEGSLIIHKDLKLEIDNLIIGQYNNYSNNKIGIVAVDSKNINLIINKDIIIEKSNLATKYIMDNLKLIQPVNVMLGSSAYNILNKYAVDVNIINSNDTPNELTLKIRKNKMLGLDFSKTLIDSIDNYYCEKDSYDLQNIDINKSYKITNDIILRFLNIQKTELSEVRSIEVNKVDKILYDIFSNISNIDDSLLILNNLIIRKEFNTRIKNVINNKTTSIYIIEVKQIYNYKRVTERFILFTYKDFIIYLANIGNGDLIYKDIDNGQLKINNMFNEIESVDFIDKLIDTINIIERHKSNINDIYIKLSAYLETRIMKLVIKVDSMNLFIIPTIKNNIIIYKVNKSFADRNNIEKMSKYRINIKCLKNKLIKHTNRYIKNTLIDIPNRYISYGEIIRNNYTEISKCNKVSDLVDIQIGTHCYINMSYNLLMDILKIPMFIEGNYLTKSKKIIKIVSIKSSIGYLVNIYKSNNLCSNYFIFYTSYIIEVVNKESKIEFATNDISSINLVVGNIINKTNTSIKDYIEHIKKNWSFRLNNGINYKPTYRKLDVSREFNYKYIPHSENNGLFCEFSLGECCVTSEKYIFLRLLDKSNTRLEIPIFKVDTFLDGAAIISILTKETELDFYKLNNYIAFFYGREFNKKLFDITILKLISK